jgi:AraC family transcriptional activator of pobA
MDGLRSNLYFSAMIPAPEPSAQPAQRDAREAVGRYFLYGEPTREADPRFLHVETIPARSRLHDWTIRPHAHAGLHQFLLITEGGGTFRAEAETRPFAAPTLFVVPAGIAHGFAFRPETEGYVVTAAGGLVAEAARGDAMLDGLLGAWFCLDEAGDLLAANDLPAAFAALAHEYVWAAPARMAAAEAHLTRILVGAARLALAHPAGRRASMHRDAVLVKEFRELVERDFRRALPLRHYAALLGLSESRLSAACRRMLGEPAQRLLHRRVMVEAQRYLVYSTLPVAEIGYALGFADPAYFSRFFTRRSGVSPAAFRLGRSIDR